MAQLSQPSYLHTLISRVRLAFRLLREPAVPFLTKAIPLAAAFYLLDPLDVVPDLLPIIGELDDLGFILLALEVFVRFCPTRATDFHRSAIEQGDRYSPMPCATRPTSAGNGPVIDAEWRRES